MFGKIKELLQQESDSPCATCPYKLGIVKTIIDPCPQCTKKGYHTVKKLFKK